MSACLMYLAATAITQCSSPHAVMAVAAGGSVNEPTKHSSWLAGSELSSKIPRFGAGESALLTALTWPPKKP